MKVLLFLCLALPATMAVETYIVGGQDAADGEWPWQLGLFSNGGFSCGANLISATWATCASHCVGNSPSQYEVMAGTNDRTCPGNACEKRTLTVANRHPDYAGVGIQGYPNDISVLSWTTTIDAVVGRIQYVPMATTTGQEGRTCYITGWGRLQGNGILPTQLQEALIDLLTTAECIVYWTDQRISDNHVCVFDKATQSRGACNGDSGGPLVCQDPSSLAWELVGLTSWGANGCETTSPSVYTRISSYYQWVLDQMAA